MTSRLARAAAALTLASIPVWSPPAAAAVTPPAVDDSLLPKPRTPSPPQPTELRQQCLVSAPIRDSSSARQLDGLDLAAAWRLSRGAGQTVAVVDTGVARHRLLPHLVPGGDYVSTGDGTDDCDGHGTVVAGIVGAAEQLGAGTQFSGVAPDATIIGIRQSSVKYAPAGQSAPGFGDVDTLAMAIRTAADMGASVINVSSIACVPAAAALDDRALGAALAYAVDVKNVVVVAAAGNVGGLGQCPDQNPPADPARPGRPDWDSVKVVVTPAWYDDYVLTVGSVDPHGAPSRFTLAGPWVDVAAPGEGVVSLDADGEGLIDSLPVLGEEMPIVGTSYAAPVVSAIAALVRARSPHMTARQVMQRIKDTAHRPPAGWDPFVGHGVVDAVAAVSGVSDATNMVVVTDEAPQHDDPSPPDLVVTPDESGRKVAFGGAGVCVAVVAAAVAMTASMGRLRRQRDTVTRE
ncbi:type VII secretion-associated serine protease mycosin [Mycobacterium sp. 1274761.0]|uniref:type VII secretion-associated serine protease mycosin n=1 Tax=Mycobacterium sp. 1274761.0 TaxID=1834077 RepID=UPI0007FF70A9|nr:type VII secretion-associated serine protease mycosin [Mycobacterium sp. 1274761.0]OBK70468.1 type VII secretion-associated serine protease mycosin [Mycobacterium sp. 1274761.0]